MQRGQRWGALEAERHAREAAVALLWAVWLCVGAREGRRAGGGRSLPHISPRVAPRRLAGGDEVESTTSDCGQDGLSVALGVDLWESD